MADDSGRSPNLRWPSVMLMLLVAWGIIKAPGPLVSTRPTVDGGALLEEREERKVHACLWQDPLATVADAVKEDTKGQGESPPAGGQGGLFATVQDFRPTGRDRFLFLPVLITSSPYDEGRESRMRQRYAVLSALALGGFQPLDSEHIAYYFPLTKGTPASAEASKSLELTLQVGKSNQPLITWLASNPSKPPVRKRGAVPFEWFLSRAPEAESLRDATGSANGQGGERGESNDEGRRFVCVMWVSDDILEHTPFSRLEKLVGDTRCRFKSWENQYLKKSCDDVGAVGDSAEPIDLQFAVLGPTSSDMLEAMVREALGEMSTCPPRKEAGVTLYSTQATSQEAWDSYEREILVHPEQGGTGPPGRLHVSLEIGRDQVLVKALADELRRRGLKDADRVALVGEWDTGYSRHLVEKFAGALVGRTAPGAISHIDRYFYLRGLDGKLSGDTPTNKSQPPAEDAPSLLRRQSARPGVIASGPSQVDYLSRLVEEIDRDSKGGELKCIGILGTDVYDKILLLRAIRPIAPQAIVFTTDLDARLLNPSEYRWTHNLLIASHFDLTLDPEMLFNNRIPPFRSSYDSSLARGCLKALYSAKFLGPGWEDWHFKKRGPVLFEIGRNGPFLLSGPGIDDRLAMPKDIAGWFNDGANLRRVLLAVALVVLFLALLRPSYWVAWGRVLMGYGRSADLRHADKTSRRYPIAWIGLGGMAAFVGLLALIVADARSPEHEPFLILDGISTWPTEFIRLLVCVLSLYATFAIMRTSDRNVTKITETFGLHHEKGEKGAHRPVRRRGAWLGGWLNSDRLWGWDHAGKEIDGVTLWDDYRHDGAIGPRVRRTLPFVIVYLAFSGLLCRLIGMPASPVRGMLNRWVDGLMLWACVVALVWLIYFVLDATRLCDHLIRLFFADESILKVNWPEGLRRTAALRQGLDEPGVKCESLAHLVTIRIVEQRTDTVDKFIYYPAVALLLMFLSRYNVFDNWDWPVSLMLIYLISSSMIVYCAVAMRRNAERLRAHALDQMREELGKVRASGELTGMVSEARILEMIREVESANRGAFCRLSDNPVIRAVLIPFGGVGTLAILDQLRPYL